MKLTPLFLKLGLACAMLFAWSCSSKEGLQAATCSVPTFSGGLVEVKMVDSTIIVDLPYASSSNFTGIKLYPRSLCFVHCDTARALSAAARELAAHGYGLKILDGYRPISLEAFMKNAPVQDRFIHHPKLSDRHARGTSVSVTLVDSQGFELAMPTPFDIITDKTRRDFDNLSEEVLFHRTLLDLVMERHGFVPYSKLWWHFDLKDYEKYPTLNIPLRVLVKEYEDYEEQKKQEFAGSSNTL